MSVVAGVNAAASLGALLGGITVGVEDFAVSPGPNGSSQATAIALGDMTAIPADVYVVPHFSGAVSYGGVGAAVARSGGLAGLETYERYVDALPRSSSGVGAEQSWGDVKFTESGGGLSTYLANVVSVGSDDVNTEMTTVSAAALNVLMEMQERGFNSVVFPALGTGIIGRLPDIVSAYAILSAIETFRRSVPDRLEPAMVTIAIYGSRRAFDAWDSILKMGPSTDVAMLMVEHAGSRKVDVGRWMVGFESMVDAVKWVRNKESEDPEKN